MSGSNMSTPPLLLVFANDQEDLFLQAKSILSLVLAQDRYLIYQLRSSDVISSSVWKEHSAALVLVKCPVSSSVTKQLTEYAENDIKKVLHLTTDSVLFSCERNCVVLEPNEQNLRSKLRSAATLVVYPLNLNEVAHKSLKDILSISFGLSVQETSSTFQLSPAHLLASTEADRRSFLTKIQSMSSSSSEFKIQLAVDGTEEAKEDLLPVLLDGAGCDTFDSAAFFSHLRTKTLGHVMLHSRVMQSSFDPFKVLRLDGLAVIPDRQTSGKGRGGNEWLSPGGCAMFSLQTSVSRRSPLGQRASILCHLVSLSVVQAITTLTGAAIGVKIKWPNDVYFGKELKLGGILIQTSFLGEEVVFTIGVGLNLDNNVPTKCLNKLLEECGAEKIGREALLAEVFNELENVMQRYQRGEESSILDTYYKFWLHSGQQVNVSDGNRVRVGIVESIDEYGFLLVRFPGDDELMTVQPDGNSFDMLHGLISPKLRV